MITGKITTYKPIPRKYTYYNENDLYGNTGSHTTMPPWPKQNEILKEMLETAYSAGLKLGARVKRNSPVNHSGIGTITHIHEAFGMAWNYTTGVLEPLRVQWDSKEGLVKCFDYGPEELTLVEDKPNLVLINHETISDLHQSC